jgi:hypothetical protein
VDPNPAPRRHAGRPHRAALATAAIVLVLALPRLGPGRDRAPASRVRRVVSAARRAVLGGTRGGRDPARAGPLKCVEQNAQNERNRLVRP